MEHLTRNDLHNIVIALIKNVNYLREKKYTFYAQDVEATLVQVEKLLSDKEMDTLVQACTPEDNCHEHDRKEFREGK